MGQEGPPYKEQCSVNTKNGSTAFKSNRKQYLNLILMKSRKKNELKISNSYGAREVDSYSSLENTSHTVPTIC